MVGEILPEFGVGERLVFLLGVFGDNLGLVAFSNFFGHLDSSVGRNGDAKGGREVVLVGFVMVELDFKRVGNAGFRAKAFWIAFFIITKTLREIS